MDASEDHQSNPAGGALRPLLHVGTRVAATALAPFTPVVEAAAEAGLSLERRAVDRLLESDELERVLTAVVNAPQIQATIQTTIQTALASDAAQQLIDEFFDSGLLDGFLDRLLASPALWHLVDEIATSPAVMAAISQQGLGFADQVGDQVRDRSRKADDWVERAARRLARRSPRPLSPEPGPGV